ncbi:hypothetical protein FH972_016563 [Carpinus fangiana]|uniref:Uncharacterized protein n=1 Tax=Carpinus fangiana TaxID=176857 RepID=A0A5N6RJK6_9ROSI|nr:hypothetical protein FH972_016563 [Carpinus fangiana]
MDDFALKRSQKPSTPCFPTRRPRALRPPNPPPSSPLLGLPIPSRRSAQRFKGEPAGSWHSSNGSSKPESHSKVEEVILKQFLNESGIRVRPSRCPSWGSSSSWVGPESGYGKWVHLRFREIERSEREAAIPCEERKWWRRGKIFALELEDRESGVEEGKTRSKREGEG